jgi:hypothetical protein
MNLKQNPTFLITIIKVCSGKGKLQGRAKCEDCNGAGFTHSSTEREHGAPENLRCFFCKNCTPCQGKGFMELRRPQRPKSFAAHKHESFMPGAPGQPMMMVNPATGGMMMMHPQMWQQQQASVSGPPAAIREYFSVY